MNHAETRSAANRIIVRTDVPKIPSHETTKQLVAVVSTGQGKDQIDVWTHIGMAYENRDGSWSLRFDYLPISIETKIQMRDLVLP